MKNLIIICFVCFSSISFGQSNLLEDPPKKTWKIIIKNKKTVEENFRLIGEKLIDNDFSIEKKDKDFYTIQSSPKNLDKLNVSYYLNFVAKDNAIVLTGMSKMNITLNFGSVTSESSYDKIINKGMKGSPSKESFIVMFKFAKLFSESDLEFIIQ